MIGLDTNILVRLLVEDDPAQTRLVNRFMQNLTADRPAFLSLIVLMELYWVLSTRYAIPRAQLLEVIRSLLALADLTVERREMVVEAITITERSRADFSDILIALQNEMAGCHHTITFDRKAAKLPQMRLLA